MILTPIKITEGIIKVNHAVVVYKTDNVAMIAIDLSSKYADISGLFDGGNDIPMIALEKGIHTKGFSDLQNDTEIELSEFRGYSFWSSEITKYTLKLCLIKEL
jgi:hypothetical protein